MEQRNVIAIDLAKDIFQVCIMTSNGKIIFSRAMNRAKLKNRPAKTEKERWLKALIERRGVNCASMALANKTARTAYALLKNNTDYKPALHLGIYIDAMLRDINICPP